MNSGHGLRERGAPSRIAAFAAQAVVAAFTAAYPEWAEDASADFSSLVERSMSDLRLAIGCPPPSSK